MGYETPNIDRIGKEGIRFLHYYGEQSRGVPYGAARRMAELGVGFLFGIVPLGGSRHPLVIKALCPLWVSSGHARHHRKCPLRAMNGQFACANGKPRIIFIRSPLAQFDTCWFLHA
jgi:hypothetical protein